MTVKVVSVRDGESWFTQGVDVNYGAQGESIEESVSNFKLGLEATIRARRVRGMLTMPPAPQPEWLYEFLSEKGNVQSEVEISDGR